MAEYTISNESIDRISEEMTSFFQENGEERQNTLRMSFLAQDALKTLQQNGGENWIARTNGTKWLGQLRFEIKVAGPLCNPFEGKEEDELLHGMLSRLQLTPTWSYRGGCNCITFVCQQKKKISTLMQMGIAMLAAVLLGFGMQMAAPQAAEFVSDAVLSPVFGTIMGLLSMTSVLVIFFSIINSMTGLGDMSTFSRIGKTVLSVLLFWLVVYSFAALVPLLFMFPIERGIGSGSDMTAVYQMILDIVPKNIVEPFEKGNMLQVIFLSVCLGIGILALGEKVEGIRELFVQAERLVQHVLSGVLSLMPVVVFISIFQIIAKRQLAVVLHSALCPILQAVFGVGVVAISLLRVSLRYHVSPLALLSKIMPTLFIGFSTSSSSAAYYSNVQTCEKKLGVDARLTAFAIPFGSVMFMPGVTILLFSLCFCFARTYAVTITPLWIITLFVMAVLLSVALPPIPGAGVTMYAIIFSQMGIPMECVALAIALDVLVDRIATVVNIALLQLELVCISDKLGMLDRTVLKNT